MQGCACKQYKVNEQPLGAIHAAQVLKQRRAMRNDFAPFLRMAFATVDPGAVYKHNWHIDLLSEYLTACYKRQLTKLIINIPPRFLKSLTTTVAFPAWVLGLNPKEQILTGSYSGSLSTKHSVDCRAIIRRPWYQHCFPELKIVDDQDTKTEFVTTERGYRVATSVKGTATGKGGNILILDDPIDPFKVHSKIEREATNDWLDSVWSSRKNDPNTSVEILIMQRVHQDDPTGHFLENSSGWEHLVIPQVAPHKTVIDFGKVHVVREEGELIHPARFDQAKVDEAKRRLGTYGFAGQHQQVPAPLEGGIINPLWFKRYKTPPALEEKIEGTDKLQPAGMLRLSLDTAFKPDQLNDPSVIEVWFESKAKHYLLDVWRDKVGYPMLKKVVKDISQKWAKHINEVLIEDKASGQSLIQDLREDPTYPWPIIAMNPGQQSKVVRMDTEAPQIEAGNVYLPEVAGWLFDFETEVANFPVGTHDDQVDAMSQYLKRIREAHGLALVRWG